jgi:phospholipid/cholesterol/gamma-HCH transport system permease protein
VSAFARTWWEALCGRGPDNAFDRYLASTLAFGPLETATGMAGLALRVLRAFLTPPFGWISEAVVESAKALRVVTIPAVVASSVYVMAFGSVIFGQIIYSLGAADRIAPGFYNGIVRELAPWLTYMVLAGVVGSSLAGDLGARRIRDELDALDVLGVDQLRALIVPRVVAITVCCVLLTFIDIFFTTVSTTVLQQFTVAQDVNTAREAINLVINATDLIAAALKSVLIGFFVAIVACYYGLNTKGGAEGVGRAVAQTVTVSFFGLWLINSLFNTGYLTLLPETITLKG